MKYSKNLGNSDGTSIGFLFYRIFMFIIAPFRLCSEISKKIIFLGSVVSDVLVMSTIINAVLFLLCALNGFLNHKFEIFEGFMPFLALGISLAINVVLTMFSYKIPRYIDLTESEKEEALKEIIDKDKVSLKKDEDNTEIKDSEKIVDEEVIMEDFLSDDFITKLQNPNSEISDEELIENLAHPNKETDRVYHLEKNEEVDDMLNLLKMRNLGNDTEVSDDEIMNANKIEIDKLFEDIDFDATSKFDEECDEIALKSVYEGNKRRAEEIGGF